jgi:hypothetical protein
MDNAATAHTAAEQLALLLAAAGIPPRDIAEALTTTGLAFLAADNPAAAAVLTEAFFEARNGE